MNKNEYAEILKEYFADCFEGGKFNVAAFEDKIMSGGVALRQNGYYLNFLGKEYARYAATLPYEGSITPAPDNDGKQTDNEYIVGDNLDALRYIKQTRAGTVDCIYIDPPYNTGSDGFIYNDKFAYTAQSLAQTGNVSHSEAQSIISLFGKSTHSAYLAFMYPRLSLARDILSDNGVIFISIDDNEYANLKLVCDEIFGEQNYITTFIWEKTQHYGRQKLNCYVNADYIICYAKNKCGDKMRELLVESVSSELQDAPLYNASNNTAEITFPRGSVKFRIPDGKYTETESEDYTLLTPVTVAYGYNSNRFTLRFKSRWSNETVLKEFNKGTTFLIKTKSFAVRAVYSADKVSTVAPKQIIFTNQANPHRTVSRYGERVDTSENATKHLSKLMGGAAFSYPKPVTLIKYLISLVYNGDREAHTTDFTVLDFFSGSGTTAQAVMELNAADGGRRKFIAVQIQEDLDEQIASYTGTARTVYENAVKICEECGLRHDIAELGRERIRRVAAAIKQKDPMLSLAIDLDFKTYYLG